MASPVVFALIVLVFFLPFVSCNGADVSGVQAATGLSPPGSDPRVEELEYQAEVPDPFAAIAFGCAVAGIGLIALRGRWGPFASALTAIGGLFAVGGFLWHATAEASGDLRIQIGLTLALLGFLLAAALDDLLLARLTLRARGDDAMLARQAKHAAIWFAVIGVLTASVLLMTARSTQVHDDASPYLLASLPVAGLALVALVFAVRGFQAAAPGGANVAPATDPRAP